MASSKDRRSGAGSGRDYSGGAGGFAATGPAYEDADADELRACIAAVTTAGDAILFARTSDGGALSVRILSAGRTFPHYLADHTALNELLTMLRRSAQG